MGDARTKQKAEKALTRVRPGHWRNQWLNLRDWTCEQGIFHPKGAHFSPFLWPSREVAEEKAKWWFDESARRGLSGPSFARYLGPVFFPDKPDP